MIAVMTSGIERQRGEQEHAAHGQAARRSGSGPMRDDQADRAPDPAAARPSSAVPVRGEEALGQESRWRCNTSPPPSKSRPSA